MIKNNTFKLYFKETPFKKGDILTTPTAKCEVLSTPRIKFKWWQNLLHFITFGKYSRKWSYTVKLIKDEQ